MENLLDAGGMEDEGDGDELFGAGYEADYRAIPQLDEYQAGPGNYNFRCKISLPYKT